MKLLVFAHTPPPHHGQSYMVQLMLQGFGGDARHPTMDGKRVAGIECYHVNARFSRSLEDVGEFQGVKIPLIFWFCLQAVWLRFRHGVTNFYYVPAPGKRVALYRDWLVMLLCRPFFRRMILHWHAAGMAKWLETSTAITSRTLTYRLFRPVDLSIVLSRYNLADGEKLLSHEVCVVNNGIPDPCPDFESAVWPRRQARAEARIKLVGGGHLQPGEIQAAGGDPQIFKVLFLAHCMREKGLFDAVEGVARANALLKKANSPLRMELSVAGKFVTAEEEAEFNRRVAELGADPDCATRIFYRGFVSGDKKTREFAENDCFCFPTYYHAESFGLVVAEAMAFGQPVVTTQWRSLPELLPPDYPGLVPVRSPDEIAVTLIKLATQEATKALRDDFLGRFLLDAYCDNLAKALRSVERE